MRNVPRFRATSARTCSLLALSLPLSVEADQATTTDLGRIEVTGSRIPSIQDESALPVQIIDREAIDRSGATSADELLRQITINSSSRNVGRNVGSQTVPGLSVASLRGLLGRSTLVLLDGRRLSPFAFNSVNGSGVDLNSIPIQAIDRVEILRDGASAIYGSDAIAGVINFILKRDFQGAAGSIQHGAAVHGGADQTLSTATFGFGDPATDGFNVFGNLDYQRRSAVTARSRNYAATGDRPDLGVQALDTDSFPANVSTADGYLSPYAVCPGPTRRVDQGCFIDAPRFSDLVPATEQSHAFLRSTLKLDANHTLFADVLHGRNRTRSTIYPTPVASDSIPSGEPISFPSTSPFFPASLGLASIDDLAYNTLPLGPRVSVAVAEQARGLFGARGQIGGWSYDTAVIFNESRVTNTFARGYVSATAIVAGLESGAINPFGDSGAAGNALLASTERRGVARRATLISRGIDGHATRALFDLPAGPVQLAVGAEGRRDSLSDVIAPFVADIAGGTYTQGKAGSRSTEAVYAELAIPVIKSLDLQVAGRYDHYSDFGGTFNPKASLRWQPLPIAALRASYGRGFRAPALAELYTAQSTETDYYRDPVRCSVTRATADCFAAVSVLSGGNPNLRAERSEQASAGLVLQPFRNVTASIDFWRLHLSREILPQAASTLFANEATYDGSLVVRDPADASGLPGRLRALDLRTINTGGVRTHGFDVALHWQSVPTAFGRFQAGLDGTYVQAFKRQLAPLVIQDQRAAYGASLVVARWKHYLSAGWDYGAWQTSINQSYEAGYRDAMLDPDGNQRHVGATEYIGAQVTYKGFRHTTIMLGIDNLFDRTPQTSNTTDFYQVGYNPSISDPRGRFWYARVAVAY